MVEKTTVSQNTQRIRKNIARLVLPCLQVSKLQHGTDA